MPFAPVPHRFLVTVKSEEEVDTLTSRKPPTVRVRTVRLDEKLRVEVSGPGTHALSADLKMRPLGLLWDGTKEAKSHCVMTTACSLLPNHHTNKLIMQQWLWQLNFRSLFV